MTDFERDGFYKRIQEDTTAMLRVMNESPREKEEDRLKRLTPIRRSKRVFAESNVPDGEKTKVTLGLCVKSTLGFLSPIFLVLQGLFR